MYCALHIIFRFIFEGNSIKQGQHNSKVFETFKILLIYKMEKLKLKKSLLQTQTVSSQEISFDYLSSKTLI